MNPGDIVFQPLAADPKSAAIALHRLSLWKVPHYSHCGVYVGFGSMITASGNVTIQDAGATGNVALPYPWKNWQTTRGLLYAQLGKPYDWFAWVLCLLQPLMPYANHPMIEKAYTCSSLVAMALCADNPKFRDTLWTRTVTPDDIHEAVA